jgi:transcriptional repressor NrdR
MVCLYCGSETKVINSRRQKRNNQVWRRRKCLACGAVFTTHEAIELESALSVSKDGRPTPFLPDLLFSELISALRHRQDAYTAAREVLGTIVKRLLALPQKPAFSSSDITAATTEVLKRFDRRAWQRYSADHPK